MDDDDEQLLNDNDDIPMRNDLEDEEAMVQQPKSKKTSNSRVAGVSQRK